MEELAYLGDQPHLPLSESTSLAEAIALCNQFYQTNLNPEDYLQTQAYMTPTGKLQIDVIPVKDGVQSDVVITFVNKAFSFVNELKAPTYSTGTLINPLQLTQYTLGPAINLRHPDELDFLKDYPLNVVKNFMDADYVAARTLADLMNTYQFLGSWVAGSMGGYSTAGFVLLSFDDNKAVIEITHGDNKGTLCLIG